MYPPVHFLIDDLNTVVMANLMFVLHFIIQVLDSAMCFVAMNLCFIKGDDLSLCGGFMDFDLSRFHASRNLTL